MWNNHTFSQRKKATKTEARGREGGRWLKKMKKGGGVSNIEGVFIK